MLWLGCDSPHRPLRGTLASDMALDSLQWIHFTCRCVGAWKLQLLTGETTGVAVCTLRLAKSPGGKGAKV